MIENLLNGKQICFCGKTHKTKIEDMYTEEKCIGKLQNLIKVHNIRKVLLLCQKEEVEKGHKIQKLLKQTGVILQKLYVDTQELQSEEQYAGWVLLRTDSRIELVIVVGKGEFVNCSRYLCDRLKMPVVLVLTGMAEINCCASWIAVHEEGIPHFHKIEEPAAVYADPDFMGDVSKMEILQSLIDIFGSQIALYDWRLAHLVTDEYYCTYLEQEVLRLIEMAEKVLKYLDNEGEKGASEISYSKAAGFVSEIQIALSLLITYSDSPRLSQGSYWLLKEFWGRRKTLFHRMDQSGNQSLALETAYHISTRVSNMVGARWKVFEGLDQGKWEKRVTALYGNQADYIRDLEGKTGKNSREKVFLRRKKAEERYREIQEIDYLLIRKESMRKIKRMGGMLMENGEGPGAEEYREGLIYAKDMLNSYNSLQFFYDLGRLEKTVEQLNYNSGVKNN